MITKKDINLIERFIDYKLGDPNVFGKKNIQRLIKKSEDTEFMAHFKFSMDINKATENEEIVDFRKKILAAQTAQKS